MKFLRTFCGLSILLTVSICSTTAATNKVFCYYQSSSVSRSGIGSFSLSDFNAHLCTHIAFGFIGLNADGTVKVDNTLFESFKRLRYKNPNVKLMLAIGGWNEGSVTYSNMASSTVKRAVFVTSVYELLNLHGFDGLDFNWQTPGLRGGLYQQDKINFAILLRELKEKFAGAKLLTATVGAAQEYLDLSYDAVQLNEYLDLINLYTYEYNGAYDPVTGRFPPAITGINAPLYAATFDVNKQLNQNASVNVWINAGVSPNKILLGIPFFGRKYNLTTQNNSVGAPSTAATTLSYIEVCNKYQSSSIWTSVFDGQRKVPYFYDDYEWISYDDARSVQIKAEYAVSQNLAGVMVWSIEDDDNKNICGGGAYPLLSTIYKVLSPMN